MKKLFSIVSPPTFHLTPRSLKEGEVDKGVTQLNANKSNGYDDITSKVIRNIPSHIGKPLTHIFNLSFVTGIIPDALKIHSINYQTII